MASEQDGSSENDNVVTMVDVLKEEEELEENAFAVLGASDEKNCTYNSGYIIRQALYSCNTCRGEDGEVAGVCLACSYACHEGHELYELYTKRNFRCDCGNSKMPNTKCSLCPNKAPLNPDNKYNHNFSGKYCTCERPFPDPENDDEMFQCVACEDWFHAKHLGSEVPDGEEFAEMICDSCMEKMDFLWYYYLDGGKASPEKPKAAETAESEDSSKATKNGDSKAFIAPEAVVMASSDDSAVSGPSDVSSDTLSSSQTRPDSEINYDSLADSGIDSSCDSIPPSSSDCKLKKLKATYDIKDSRGATFWTEDWRLAVCKCPECRHNYSVLDCSFVCDQEDTVHHYENLGKNKNNRISQYEKGLEAIKKMDRIKSIEAIYGFNMLTTELKDYLKKFADNNKVVRPEDIQEFFEGLSARKRLKTELSYYCR